MVTPAVQLNPLGDPSPYRTLQKVILSQGCVLQKSEKKNVKIESFLRMMEAERGKGKVQTNRFFKFNVLK